MKSLRDEMHSIKKSAKEVELDQSSTSASKPGPSKQSDNLPPNTAPNAPNTQSKHTNEAMELDLYSPSLPPQFGDAQSEHGSALRSFRTTRTGVFVQSQKTFGQTQTQVSGQIYFSVVIHQRRISPLLTRKGLLSPLGPLLN